MEWWEQDELKRLEADLAYLSESFTDQEADPTTCSKGERLLSGGPLTWERDRISEVKERIAELKRRTK